MLYDQQQDNLIEKTTFTHIVDVLKYYNNSYNPILKLKPDEDDEASIKQERMKDESILKMSGQHLLNYVLKKKPNVVEHDFIINIMDILIEEEVQF